MWLTAFLDLPAETFDGGAGFWRDVTGAALSPPRGQRGEFVSLLPAGGDPWLRVQRLSTGPARIHLDLHPADPEELRAEAVRLGAALLGRDPVTSFASPGGMLFCIVDGQLSTAAPTPSWPHLSRVDQVCLDIPGSIYDAEAAFWSGMLGRGVTPSPTYAEFARIDWRPTDPLKILLQRCGHQGPVRAHLDLATTDRPAEVARLTALGARPVRETPKWTTLLDPSGLEFCVTARVPTTP